MSRCLLMNAEAGLHIEVCIIKSKLSGLMLVSGLFILIYYATLSFLDYTMKHRICTGLGSRPDIKVRKLRHCA